MVLDTNVIVAALRSSRGASFAVLSRVGTGRFEHVVSVALVLEYEAALKHPRAGARLKTAEVDDILDYLCSTGVRQRIDFLWRPALPDPGDDLVLEVAVNGGGDTIVTFNVRDFSGADRFGVGIQTPQVFLRSLEVKK